MKKRLIIIVGLSVAALFVLTGIGFAQDSIHVDSNGYVGIGTASPTSELHIKQSSDDYDGGITIESVGGKKGMIMCKDQNDTTNFFFKTDQTDPTKSYNLAIISDHVAVTSDLYIFGNLYQYQPDYVFDENYKLPSLEETEAYVKLNKHLPDIPSAKEIEKKGFKVGDMMARHLKKIEELTLHLINLKKENNTLKKRIDLSETKLKELEARIAGLEDVQAK